MEMQLQELIEKIKTDGVAAAEQDAAQKVAAADAEAKRIVAEAKAEADKILRQAKEESERFARAGEDAVRQAGRNLLISFRDSVTKELDGILKAQVTKEYSSDVLAAVIPKAVEAWAANVSAENVAVLLNESDLKAVEESLVAALKGKLLTGVTLKADGRFNGGFRIVAADGGAYYDFSADTVADMFSAYLNPKVAALLKEAGSV